MTIRKGDNFLDVILKHQFSQITTTIGLGNTHSSVGGITAIGETTISPTHNSASIMLTDGTLTYNGSPTEATVNFPSLGGVVRSVTASPTLLIAPATTSAEFILNSITADGMTRDLVLDDIKITPGVRYNLNLDFFIPCTEVVGVEEEQIFNWKYTNGQRPDGSLIEHNITAPNADFGFVFDLTILDNSFGMTINGVDLITHSNSILHRQVQFQGGDIENSPKNIRFADGTQYAVDIDEIYNITGTAAKPMIRVVISPEGEISMYGSKTSGGDLYPLELTGGFSFNNVPWNADAANEVIVTQLVTGETTMTGSGAGKQIVPCPL
ncbi:fimbrillin family protein [Albibacterium indicum]|uniref:fimbrillin family protein n=1 Tax=Albibacterium indicum TaxID=2292082 RepID=UPI000E486885|nr:fimbrillin family protein [Pedobacter indicus]